MAFLHLWCRKYLKWPPWREGKKERRELWLKIVPWNVRLFFNYQPVVRCSMGQLKIGGIPPYWHQSGSKFSPLRRENWPVRKLEAASNPFVPHSSLEAMTQRMRHWALQNTPADLFDAPRAKCKSQSTLITGGVTTCRAGGSKGARIFSCYSRMMLRTTTLIHTTVPGHSFIPSSSYGWYFL